MSGELLGDRLAASLRPAASCSAKLRFAGRQLGKLPLRAAMTACCTAASRVSPARPGWPVRPPLASWADVLLPARFGLAAGPRRARAASSRKLRSRAAPARRPPLLRRFGRGDFGLRRLQPRAHVAGLVAHRQQIAAVQLRLFLQLARCATARGRSSLAAAAMCCRANASWFSQFRSSSPAAERGRFQLELPRFQPLRLGIGRLRSPRATAARSASIAGKLLGQPPPIDQGDLRAQLLQPLAVFAIAAGLAGLRPHGLQPVLDLLDDVGQPQQVLLDPLQPPLGLDLLGLEAADAGGLLEDRPAVLGRGLQQPIDLALLDQAVGIDADAGAAKQVADVLQPGTAGG